MFIWGLREKKLYLIWHFVVSYLRTKQNKSRHGKTGQNFLTPPDLKKTLPEPPFFFTRNKNGLTHDLTCVFASQPDPTCDLTRTRIFFFLKLFFLVKKITKLRQYWFNCLFWVLRKQLIYLHNCMQINWEINSWAFCNE